LKCFWCGHLNRACRFPIRCLSCYNYGHRARQCLNKSKRQLHWKPKYPLLYHTESSPRLCWKPKYSLNRGPNSNQSSHSLEGAFTPPRETLAPLHSSPSISDKAAILCTTTAVFSYPKIAEKYTVARFGFIWQIVFNHGLLWFERFVSCFCT
jgi:hypothetical protein